MRKAFGFVVVLLAALPVSPAFAQQPTPDGQPAPVEQPEAPPAPVEEPPPPPPPTAVVVPETPIETAVDPAAEKERLEKERAAAKKLPIGSLGFWQPGSLLQGWYQLERNDGATTLSNFRVRRAEFSAKGEILPKRVGFQVMLDAAKVRETARVTVAGPPDAEGNPTTVTINNPTSAVSVFQDFFITGITKYADVSLGQFKIPVSYEGYNSSSKLLFPERALSSLKFGDKRDIGVRIAKSFDKFGYSAGIFNGTQLNAFDNNNQKDVALRLEAYPIKGLTIAAVTYDSVAQRKRAGTKDRWEADLRYEGGPVLFQAEYIRAKDIAKDNADAVSAQGFYGALGVTIKGLGGGDLQPIVRVGYVDSNIDANVPDTGDDEVRHYDVGLNYYLKGHEMKVQASFQRQDFDDKTDVDQFIFAAQVWY